MASAASSVESSCEEKAETERLTNRKSFLEMYHFSKKGQVYLNKTESDVLVKLLAVLWTVERRDGDCC